MKIEVTQAAIDDKHLIQRMLEFYQYDFSEFDDADLDSHGTYGYPWLDHYWSEKGRCPFIIRVDGKLAGFVLVNQNTYLQTSEWAISEFFIMRKYRKHGVGKVVAFSMFDQFSGKWEVHELESNIPSQLFWRKVISEYTQGQYTETKISDERSPGPIQCFDNSGKIISME
jgi:predicted acetyltransferase